MTKNRNPMGRALRNPLFRQRVVRDRKAESKRRACRTNPKKDFTMTKNGGGSNRLFHMQNNNLMRFLRQG